MTYERTTGTQRVVQERRPWTEEENKLLRKTVEELGAENWPEIAKRIPGRTYRQCYGRYWNERLNPEIKKGPWTEEEDELLRKTVEELGTGNWVEIAKRIPGRTYKQCYGRYWNERLNPEIKKGPWTEEEDELLRKTVEELGTGNWEEIAKEMLGRTYQQCHYHWNKCLDPKIKKGKWSSEEDELLRGTVERLGAGNWTEIAKEIPGKTNKQCRERWVYYLDQNLTNKEEWTPEEYELLIEKQREFGNKWNVIATYFPGRSYNNVKNHWYLLQRKKSKILKDNLLFINNHCKILKKTNYLK